MALIDLTLSARIQPKGTSKKKSDTTLQELDQLAATVAPQQFPQMPPPQPPPAPGGVPQYAYGTDDFGSYGPWDNWWEDDLALFRATSPTPTFSDIVPPGYTSLNVIDKRTAPLEPETATAAGAQFFAAPADADVDASGNWWDSGAQAWRDPNSGLLWSDSLGWYDPAQLQYDFGAADDASYFEATTPRYSPALSTAMAGAGFGADDINAATSFTLSQLLGGGNYDPAIADQLGPLDVRDYQSAWDAALQRQQQAWDAQADADLMGRTLANPRGFYTGDTEGLSNEEAWAQYWGNSPTMSGAKQIDQGAGYIVKNAFDMATSGERFLKEFTGLDTSGLPDNWYFPLRQAVDVAAAPATWATVGLGPSVPVVGSAFGGSLPGRIAGEIALGTAGLVGGQKSAELASQYTDNPYLIGGAGLAGGLLAGGAAYGGVRAAPAISDVLKGTPAYLREAVESGAKSFTPRMSIEEQMARGAIDPATGKALGFAPILGGADEGLSQGDDLVENAARRDALRFLQQEQELRNQGVPTEEIRQRRGEAFADMGRLADEAEARGLTGIEQADFIRQGLKTGTMRSTYAEPIPPEQFPLLYDIVTRAWRNGEINEGQYATATRGLNRARMEGGVQPAEGKLLRQILGDDIGERLSVPYSGKIKVEDAGVGQAPTRPLPGFEDDAVRGVTGERNAPLSQGSEPLLQESPTGELIPRAPEKPANPLDVSGPADSIDTLRARNELMSSWAEADRLASAAEREAFGLSKTDWRGDRAKARRNQPLSSGGLLEENSDWQKFSAGYRLNPETNQWVKMPQSADTAEAAVKAAILREQADELLGKLNEAESRLNYPKGEGPRGGQGPDMRAIEHVAPEGSQLSFTDEVLYGAGPVKPANPLDPAGPSTPIDTLQRRNDLMMRYDAADKLASEAERAAFGISKTDWRGDKAVARENRPLSAKGVRKEDKQWRRITSGQRWDSDQKKWVRVEQSPDDVAASIRAAAMRQEADSLLSQLDNAESRLEFPKGEGQRGGQGPDMRTVTDINKPGDLVLRNPTAADVDLGIVPNPGESRSVAASRRGLELTSLRKKAANSLLQTLNLSRAVKAGGELSGALRQAAPLAPAHPVAFKKAMVSQVKAYAKQENYDVIVADLRSRPLANLRRKAGLFMANEAGDNLNQREEAFIASFANGIVPNSLQKFNVFKKGERGYIAMLDTIRAEVFDSTVEKWMKQGYAPTESDLKRLAEYVNHATGRGTGSVFDRSGALMSTVLFAPRYIASKPQMLWDLVAATPAVRKEVAKGVGAWLGTIAGLTALSEGAKQAGIWDGDVDVGPLSGGFGKLKVGNYGFDLTSGFGGEIRTLARYADAAYRLSQGEKVYNTPAEITQRWFRGKLSPNAALVVDLHLGEDYMGRKVNLDTLDGAQRAALNTFGNLFAEDLYRIAKEEFGDGDFSPTDVLTFAAAASLSFFGAPSGLRDKTFNQSKADAYAAWAKDNGIEETDLGKASQLDRARFENEKPEYYADKDSTFGAIKIEAANRQTALESDFMTGEIKTLGDYNDTRKLNAAEFRGRYTEAAKDLPDKELADKVYQSYLEIFDEAVDPDSGFLDGERFAQLEHEWEKNNPKEYVEAVAAARNDGPVEGPRRAAMNQLAADGFFTGEEHSIPRFLVKVSDATDKEIIALAAEVKAQSKNPFYDGLDYETRALVYLSEMDVPADVILDVMEATKKSNVHPEFEFYKATHPDLLIWLDSAATWDIIQANQR